MEATGAFDFLDDTEKADLHRNWPVIANMAFTLVNGDHGYAAGESADSRGWAAGGNEEMMLLATFATYSTYILQNHYPEINLAWARAYDSYYTGELAEYETLYGQRAAGAGYSVASPTATGKDNDGKTDRILQEGADKNNQLAQDQRIVLEVGDIVGEAIYYDLVDNTTDKQLAQSRLYRGGVDLPMDSENGKSYTLSTYAISYGVRSPVAVYNVHLTKRKHDVTVIDFHHETKRLYDDKDTVSATAEENDDRFFIGWNAKLLDKEGNTIADDITDRLLGEEADEITATFTMPESLVDSYDGTNTYPEGYGLVLEAQYGYRLREIDASPTAPVADVELAKDARLILSGTGSGKEGTYPISWTYTYTADDGSEKTVATSGTAYRSTRYTATITVPQDKADSIVFAAESDLRGTSHTCTVKKVTRDDADGSATIAIEFPETASDAGPERPDTDIKLTVRTYDLNFQQYDDVVEKYHVLQDTKITLAAPELELHVYGALTRMQRAKAWMQFCLWECSI